MAVFFVTGGSGFIGTNLVAALAGKGHGITNLDIRAPLCSEHHAFWTECDIMDRGRLNDLFERTKPECVIHLAARTDCDEETTVEQGYKANTEGTANVVEAVRQCPSVKRLIITSTQYVCQPGYTPEKDDDYNPHTVYGQSKVRTEQITRSANPSCVWTIIRPVNIWGPWHMRYRREFWRVVERGLYFHPGRTAVIRTYGYVENMVDQMFRILAAREDLVNRKTWYVGDLPIDIYEWANGFSIALTGRSARIAPRCFVKSLALFGDFAGMFNIGFPITSSRFRSMTESFQVPIKNTLDAFGPNPCSLEEGVNRTVKWLKAYNARMSTNNES